MPSSEFYICVFTSYRTQFVSFLDLKADLIVWDAVVKELAMPIQAARGAQQACLQVVGVAAVVVREVAVVSSLAPQHSKIAFRNLKCSDCLLHRASEQLKKQ